MISKAWFFGCLLLLSPAVVRAEKPPAEILGVRLGMSEDAVQRRLIKVGSPDSVRSEEEADQQLWKVRDRRFASLLVHLDHNHCVDWVTAYAREGGRRLRYSDVADTSLARHAGFHIFTWTMAKQGSRAAYVVTARGKSPEFLSSLSLSPLPPSPKQGRD